MGSTFKWIGTLSMPIYSATYPAKGKPWRTHDILTRGPGQELWVFDNRGIGQKWPAAIMALKTRVASKRLGNFHPRKQNFDRGKIGHSGR
jgi:hypothetical protein